MGLDKNEFIFHRMDFDALVQV